jgi:hypothetical protein
VSADGRGAVRVASDFYPTPAACVARLLEVVNLPSDGLWLEPAAGDGAIIRAIGERRWIAIEIREECRLALGGLLFDHPGSSVGIADFLSEPVRNDYRVVITNPPYSLALEFIKRSFQVAPNAWIVMLLRLNFAASQKRAAFMRAFPPDVYVLPNRPSFTGTGKTDATEYAWFIWPAEPARSTRKCGTFQVLRTNDGGIE